VDELRREAAERIRVALSTIGNSSDTSDTRAAVRDDPAFLQGQLDGVFNGLDEIRRTYAYVLMVELHSLGMLTAHELEALKERLLWVT
jgi:hypothetical protein